MALTTAERYITLIKGLLPPGPAWSREEGLKLHGLTDALAQEMARLDTRAQTLLALELEPSKATELLPDWERVLGITSPASTVAGRRNQIVQKLTSRGGQSVQYFIDLAAALGFAVTITEFRAFKAGRAKAGDPITNGDWVYTWRVNAAATTIIHFRAGQSAAGEPVAEWGNATLEATITRLKPAHTRVLFSYA